VINSCSGEVQFNDLSSSATSITSYIWDFGDGTTSAEQNPLHHYNGSGTYSVSLYVSNQNGTENYTVFNAVTVDMPDAPEVNDGFSCGPGDVNVSVEANGDNIDWFDDMNAMSPVFTGNAYTFNNLTETTTWYVQETLAPEIEYVGMFDNEGPGGYFNFNIWRSVSITAHQDLTIKSIKFFADGGGQRIIYVYDDGGNLLTQYTVGIPNGEHRIDVNIPLPEGNYLFYVNQQNNLAFTGDYGGPDVGYPFSVDGLISITGNNYSNSFFYFFYDIEVFAGYSEFCLTPKVPVTAYVLYPHPELDDVTNCCSGQACWLDAGANFDEYLWSTSQTDQEIEASQGNYTVSVTDSFGCTGEGSTEVVVNAMGDLSLTIEHVTVFGANDGSIVAEVIGGTPPYSFAWSNGETTPEINGLEPGTYTLTIIDASGCLYVDTVVVQLLSSIDSWSSEVKIYPNPIITSCIVEFPNEKINISLYNSLGVLLYAVKDAQDIAQINMSELPLGFYILEINSARGSLTRRLIKQ
jgi:PKD repeat protein